MPEITLTLTAETQDVFDYLKLIGDKRAMLGKSPGFSDEAFWQTHEALCAAFVEVPEVVEKNKELLTASLSGKKSVAIKEEETPNVKNVKLK